MASFKQMRELAGLTQQEVAAAAGLDRAIVCLIEKGQLKPSTDRSEKIRRVLFAAMKKRSARLLYVLESVERYTIPVGGERR